MKKFICGIVVGAVCSMTIGGLATGVWDNISVLRNDITVVVNGETVTADNFLYNDTTYLPLRAVSTALGENVDYDEATNTAYIGEKGDNMNTTEIKSKYTPPENVLKNIQIQDGYYYLTISTIMDNYCDNKTTWVENENNKEIFTFHFADGSTKTLQAHLIEWLARYGVLYDEFVEEILPLLQ